MAIIPNSTTDHSTNRDASAMVYDASRTQLMMYGGKNISSLFADTWTQNDGGGWARQFPNITSGVVNSPGLRYNHAMAYNPTTHLTYVFGGNSEMRILSDTWSWNGSAWTKLSLTTFPSQRYGHEMVGDGYNGGNIVLFGGVGTSPNGSGKTDNFQYLQDTWVLSSTGTWKTITSAKTPLARAFHTMAYNGSNVIMWGGENNDGTYLNDMWQYTDASTQWTAVSQGTTVPSARRGASMVYDTHNSRLFLFGGMDQTYSLSCETWVFSSGTWTKLTTATHPTARWNATMAFDSGTNKITLFGGRGNGIGSYNDVLGDIWTFDCVAGTWSGAGDFEAAQSTGPVF